MAKKNNADKASDEVIVEKLSNKSIAEVFEEKKDIITYGLIGLFVIVGGYLLYRQMVITPKSAAAIEQIAKAQFQFEQDSFALSLTNPGDGFPGFLDIASDYSGTATGNIALYYAGISYLNLGQFDAAIDYLKDFSPSGDVTPSMRAGALGDAYSEKNDFAEALSYYKKAVSKTNNGLIAAYYLKKVGMLNEHQGNKEAAREAYQTIKDKHFNTPISSDIDKFLIRVAE